MPVNYYDVKRDRDGYTPTGVNNNSNIRGDRITTSEQDAPNILTVSGDVILRNGAPIRELGLNEFNGLARMISQRNQINYYPQMKRIREFGARYIRSSIGFFSYLGGANSINYYFKTTEQAKQEYLGYLKSYLDAAHQNGIGVMLGFFYGPWTVPDSYGQRLVDAYGLDGNLKTTSSSMVLMEQIIQTVVTTFKDHPAVSAWECQNEWDLIAAYQTLPEVRTHLGTLSSYTSPDDVITQATAISLTKWIAEKIRFYDPSDRLLISGNNGPIRQSSFEYAFGDESVPSGDYSTTYMAAAVIDENQPPINALSIHRYSQILGGRSLFDSYDLLVSLRRKSKEVSMKTGRDLSFMVGEFGAAWWASGFTNNFKGYNGNTDLVQYEKGLSSLYQSGTQLAFMWAWLEKDVPYSDANGDWNFHPDYDYANYKEKSKIVQKWMHKFRSEDAYVDPFELPLRTNDPVMQNGMVSVRANGYQSVMTANLSSPSDVQHDDNYGITLDAWVYIENTDSDLYDRTLIDVSDTEQDSTMMAGVRVLVSGTQGAYDQNRVAPTISLTDANGDLKRYNPGKTSCPGPGNIIKGWNHLYFQVATNPSDINFGITFGWNGHKMFIDGVLISNRVGSIDGSSILFRPMTSPRITVFGNYSPTQTTAPFIYWKARPVYAGIANLRFYRRSLSDAELTYSYISGISTRDYSLRSTSKDLLSPAEKLVFTFDNTYTSTNGLVTFEPYKYNGTPLCSPATFAPIVPRIYWENKENI